MKTPTINRHMVENVALHSPNNRAWWVRVWKVCETHRGHCPAPGSKTLSEPEPARGAASLQTTNNSRPARPGN